MKKWKKVLCLSLCLLLIFAVGDKYQIVAHAELTNDSIKQKEAEIAKAKISPVKVKIIQKAIEDTNTVLEKFLSYFGVTKINDIVEGQFQQAMSMLDKKKEEMAKEKKNDVGGIVW